MPLRDHFRAPVEKKHSWGALHAMWPAEIVRQLFPLLPEEFVAAPGVHLGTFFKIDVSVYDAEQVAKRAEKTGAGEGGVATLAPPIPTLTLETDWPDQAASVQDTFQYAATLRGRKRSRQRPLLDAWFYPMILGQPLPSLPIWLDVDLRVVLELETSYEESCRLLHIA